MSARVLVGQSLHEFSPSKPGVTALPVVYAITDIWTLTAEQKMKLLQILWAGEWTDESQGIFYVTPRPGMRTPISSKICDVLEACGVPAGQVERILRYRLPDESTFEEVAPMVTDRMQQSAVKDLGTVEEIFVHNKPWEIQYAPLMNEWFLGFEAFNKTEKLWLSRDQLVYLESVFRRYNRDPSELELFCFAQANSEHCRHGTFNASWTIDGINQERTMFQHIKATHAAQIAAWNQTSLSVYSDNAAVFSGWVWYYLNRSEGGVGIYEQWPIHNLLKVETHNHPTSISPFPWAATGSGWEIRDEGAVGRWAKPKAWLTGFMTSHLNIPDFTHPWETDPGKPWHIENALGIMTTGPLGSAAFNNEFGRPNLTGHFRTFGMNVGWVEYGYHKPIMLAGGIGSVLPENVHKVEKFPVGTLFVQLGWPGLLVGLGGGNASSQNLGTGDIALDFASVQRENPEMQRRCQEVITACLSLRGENPIISIHDVWAGGVGNALPELAHSGGVGAVFDLRAIPVDDHSMSPREIWSNESQERYVLAIPSEMMERFEAICAREKAPFAVVWVATEEKNIIVKDGASEVMNMTVEDLLEAKVLTQINATRQKVEWILPLNFNTIGFQESIKRILLHPAVADKTWLINIWDRTVGWLTHRDQMVGPWQVPVADVAVTLRDHIGYAWEALTTGERTPLSIIHPEAAARMAVGEVITNILASAIRSLEELKLSGNWMASMKDEREKTKLYDAVQAISDFCIALGIAIPVGKDSLSMKTQWKEGDKDKSVTSPVSPVITGMAPVVDVRKTLTPELKRDQWDTKLFLVDLGKWKNRMWGSILWQVWKQYWDETPDIEAETLKNFALFMLECHQEGILLAYHDRSDGGLYATLLEMAFASHSGMHINMRALTKWSMSNVDVYRAFFTEELGGVIQVKAADTWKLQSLLEKYGLSENTHFVGTPDFTSDHIWVETQWSDDILGETRTSLQKLWSETSYRMQALRDNPVTAKQESDRVSEKDEPAMLMQLTFDVNTHPAHDILAKYNADTSLKKPRIAVLREQGVNGHEEMMAAFMRAGFETVDVTMTDLQAWRQNLADFSGIAVSGGFSYGDVTGAGRAWAQVILNNPELRTQFESFFARNNTFGIGVCNGNQMLSQLKDIIPWAEHWPSFSRNIDGPFKARYSPVTIWESASIFLRWMAWSTIPMVSAHGEGKASDSEWTVMQYVDNHGNITTNYPQNPNGSPEGATGFTTTDGRFTTMMPHPERTIRTVQCSWLPWTYQNDKWDAPWMQGFYNLREWTENNK